MTTSYNHDDAIIADVELTTRDIAFRFAKPPHNAAQIMMSINHTVRKIKNARPENGGGRRAVALASEVYARRREIPFTDLRDCQIALHDRRQHSIAQKQKALQHVLRRLPRRLRFVLEAYFGLNCFSRPHTLAEIGRKLGVTHARVGQMKDQALARLQAPRQREQLVALLEDDWYFADTDMPPFTE